MVQRPETMRILDAYGSSPSWTGTRQRSDLKCCPFCGAAAIQQIRLASSAADMQHRILCGNPFCHVELQAGPCAALKDAEAMWEERAP